MKKSIEKFNVIWNIGIEEITSPSDQGLIFCLSVT